MFQLALLSLACATLRTVKGAGTFVWSNVEVLDVQNALGYKKGFKDGFRSGAYGYLIPRDHAKVVRFDLATFQQVTVLDLMQNNPLLGGFISGFTDDTYGYATPGTLSFGNAHLHGSVTRFSLATFDYASVTVLQMATVNPNFKESAEACVDTSRSYGYVLFPYQATFLTRFQLSSFSNVEVLNLAVVDPGHGQYYRGCFDDGTYGYIAPRDVTDPTVSSVGYLARFRLNQFSPSSTELLQLAPTINSNYWAYCGGFVAGSYGYLTGGAMRTIVRFSLSTFANVQGLMMDNSYFGCGGFSDGTYGYTVNNKPLQTRFPLSTFYPIDKETMNLADMDPTLVGYNNGFRDSLYGYLVPEFDYTMPQSPNTKIVRFPLMPPPTTTTTTTTSANTTTTSNTTTTTMRGTSSTTRAISSTTTTIPIMPTLTTGSSKVTIEEPTTSKQWTPLIIACELIARVSNASAFVEDPAVFNALRDAIAEMFDASSDWVHNLEISLKQRRILSVGATHQYGDVHIRWQIIAPEGTDEASVIVLFDNYNSMAIAETTQIIRNKLSQIESALGYELEVTWQYGELKRDGEGEDREEVEQDSSSTIFIVIAIASILPCIALLFIITQWARRNRTRKLEYGTTNCENDLKTPLGPYAEWTPQSFLYPPKVITVEQGDGIRRLAQSMQLSATGEIEVFLIFATGTRAADAEGMGPGMFFAMAILKLLHEAGVQCYSELMMPWEMERKEFCDLISSVGESCKAIIVIQTQALYRCRHALEEIYTAQELNAALLPVCFEEDLPAPGTEWPEITREDIDGMIMVSHVQSAFCNLIPTPTPPSTIPGDPKFLDVVLADVCAKVARHLPRKVSAESMRSSSDENAGLHNSLESNYSSHEEPHIPLILGATEAVTESAPAVAWASRSRNDRRLLNEESDVSKIRPSSARKTTVAHQERRTRRHGETKANLDDAMPSIIESSPRPKGRQTRHHAQGTESMQLQHDSRSSRAVRAREDMDRNRARRSRNPRHTEHAPGHSEGSAKASTRLTRLAKIDSGHSDENLRDDPTLGRKDSGSDGSAKGPTSSRQRRDDSTPGYTDSAHSYAMQTDSAHSHATQTDSAHSHSSGKRLASLHRRDDRTHDKVESGTANGDSSRRHRSYRASTKRKEDSPRRTRKL